jgi:hypothetical protein
MNQCGKFNIGIITGMSQSGNFFGISHSGNNESIWQMLLCKFVNNVLTANMQQELLVPLVPLASLL